MRKGSPRGVWVDMGGGGARYRSQAARYGRIITGRRERLAALYGDSTGAARMAALRQENGLQRYAAKVWQPAMDRTPPKTYRKRPQHADKRSWIYIQIYSKYIQYIAYSI